MGNVKLNAGGQCLRFLLIAWNVIVFIVGVVALGVGIWQVVQNEDYETLTGENNASGAIVSIVAGVVAMTVAVLGICGGIALWRVALGLYALIVTVFIILELVSGILGFVYRNELESTVTDNALDAIADFTNETNSNDNNIINRIQNDFECCGWDNYTDWNNSAFFIDNNGQYPDSCGCGDDDDEDDDGDDDDDCILIDTMIDPMINGTNNTNPYIYNTGCRDSVVDILEAYQLIIGAIGIAFAALQILAVLYAVILCGCVHKAHGEYTTV